MSDCSTNAFTPVDASVLSGCIVFADGTSQPLVFNRLGRRVERFEMDGERFERVRECDVEKGTGMMRGWWVCKSCGDAFGIAGALACKGERKPNHCPSCGGKARR